MNVTDELRNVIGQIKQQLVGSQEIGLDPPFISSRVLRYLNRGPQEYRGHAQEALQWNSLEQLEDFISDCVRCGLSRGRKNLVFGEGLPHARLVFVGEAPGVEEDARGKPFVGAAGKLLNDIIKAMGLKREEVYICNIVKCHPPGNRDPRPEEIEMCLPFLKAQISLIAPEIICTLGRISAQSLVNRIFKITRDRGQWCEFCGIPVMPTYHPAYLLRYPQAKRQVWDDVREIMKVLGLKDPREVRD